MEEIAQVYARSLFEVATEHDKLDVVRDQLAEFAEALDASHELRMFFFSPYFSTDEKQEGLRQTVTEADESFLNFLSLLLENHRMPVIFRVRREYDRLWREANHLLAVQITSAVQLDPSVAERVGDGAYRGADEQRRPRDPGWDRRACRELHHRRIHPHPTRQPSQAGREYLTAARKAAAHGGPRANWSSFRNEDQA
jgi:F-type H+-transporting ATPase subunit delta